jgi:hypothetical protein
MWCLNIGLLAACDTSQVNNPAHEIFYCYTTAASNDAHYHIDDQAFWIWRKCD